MEVLGVGGFGEGYVWGVGDFVDPLSGWVVRGCLGLFVGGRLVEVYGLGVLGFEAVREFLLNVPEGDCVSDMFVEFLCGECFYYWDGFGNSRTLTNVFNMVKQGS